MAAIIAQSHNGLAKRIRQNPLSNTLHIFTNTIEVSHNSVVFPPVPMIQLACCSEVHTWNSYKYSGAPGLTFLQASCSKLNPDAQVANFLGRPNSGGH